MSCGKIIVLVLIVFTLQEWGTADSSNSVNMANDTLPTIHWESLRLGMHGAPFERESGTVFGFLQVVMVKGSAAGFFLWETKEALTHSGVPYRSIAIDPESFIVSVRKRYPSVDDFGDIQGDLVGIGGKLEILGSPGHMLGIFREVKLVSLNDYEQKEYQKLIRREEGDGFPNSKIE